MRPPGGQTRRRPGRGQGRAGPQGWRVCQNFRAGVRIGAVGGCAIRKGSAMERLLRMSEEQFVSAMLPEVRKVLREVAAAVNDAPDGRVIDGSEMKVRDLMAGLRARCFETALQMRVDDTEGA